MNLCQTTGNLRLQFQKYDTIQTGYSNTNYTNNNYKRQLQENLFNVNCKDKRV